MAARKAGKKAGGKKAASKKGPKKSKLPASKTKSRAQPAKPKKPAEDKRTLQEKLIDIVKETSDPKKGIANSESLIFGLNPEQLWSRPTYFTSTQSLSIDKAIGRTGLPGGRVVEVYGPEGCLDGDTFVRYEVRTADGRRINHKGGTLRRLWERFHGEPASGNRQGKYLRPSSVGAEFFAPSINEEDRIFQNRIEDVVRIGERECWELTMLGGDSVVATDNHRFFNGTKYVRVDQLEPGDVVLMHTSTPFRNAEPSVSPTRRAYLYVKHHPVAGTKFTTDRESGVVYEYRRLLRSRAVVEAHANDLTLDEYVGRLDAGDLAGLVFLSRDDNVHHKDEDESNDDRGNLVVVKAAKHARMHALERHNNLRYVATEDVVASIVPVGKREVFDLKMTAPFHNYVANRFITHNCGKSTLCDHLIAECQQAGGVAAVADTEHVREAGYLTSIGVNEDELVVIQAQTLEGLFEAIEWYAVKLRAAVGPGLPVLLVWDSVAATPTMAEMEAEAGDQFRAAAAKVLRQSFRRVVQTLSKEQVTLVATNQLYSKVGGGGPKFYGSDDETYGGGAFKYYSTIRMGLRIVGRIYPPGTKKDDKKGVPPMGQIVSVTTTKNKVAPPNRYRTFAIIYGRGIDNVWSLWNDFVNQPGEAEDKIISAGSTGWYGINERFGKYRKWQSWEQCAHWGLVELCNEDDDLWQKLVGEYAELPG